ncbi:MAG: hypothetical protein IH899_13165, partial [Planctomycetes bacterium]|nr:hypothetical protein [Planctomycetota bacterium]
MNVMHPSGKHRLNVRVSGFFICVSAVAVLLTYVVEAKADPNFSAEQVEFFESKVRPLLVRHCYECHSEKAKKLKGGLRLDGRKLVLKGGESGAAVVPGKPGESLLIESVRWQSLEMPPKGK